MKKTLILSCALALAGLSTSAMAAEGQGFVRGEIGSSNIEFDDMDSNETAHAVRGGYFFNANVGVEGFYANYGDDSDGGVTAKLTGFGAGLVAKKNFAADTGGFYIDGRAGIVRAKADVSFFSLSGTISREDTTTSPYVGFGVGYDFSESFGLSANYNYVRAEVFNDDVTAHTVTVGAEVRF